MRNSLGLHINRKPRLKIFVLEPYILNRHWGRMMAHVDLLKWACSKEWAFLWRTFAKGSMQKAVRYVSCCSSPSSLAFDTKSFTAQPILR